MSPAKSSKGEPGTVREFMSVNLVSCHRIARKRTAEIARNLTQGLHTACFGPDEGFINSCSAGSGVGETHDRPVIVDCCGSIPGIASDVAKISRNTVFPKHRMSSANTSDRNTTIAGDADHLTEVINCCGCTSAVARQWWEFLHSTIRLPDRRPEPQDLEGRIAS